MTITNIINGTKAAAVAASKAWNILTPFGKATVVAEITAVTAATYATCKVVPKVLGIDKDLEYFNDGVIVPAKAAIAEFKGNKLIEEDDFDDEFFDDEDEDEDDEETDVIAQMNAQNAAQENDPE